MAPEVEHGTFISLMMSTTGGMGKECKKFYSQLSEIMSDKQNQPYSIVAAWIQKKVSLSFVKSISMCIQQSKSVSSSNQLV